MPACGGGTATEKASEESVTESGTQTEATPEPEPSTNVEPPVGNDGGGEQPTGQEPVREPSMTPDEASNPEKTEPASTPEEPATGGEQSTMEMGAPELDPDAPVVGGNCQSSAPKCAAGYGCRDDATPPTCHRLCDPNNPSCPSGTTCLVLSSGEGLCVQGNTVNKGEACDFNKICAKGLICVLSSGSAGTCYQRCTLDALQCSSGEFCYLVHSKNGACLQGQAGQKAAGEACTRTTECATGLVCFVPLNQNGRCAALCDTTHPCPQGKSCVELKDAPKGSGACD